MKKLIAPLAVLLTATSPGILQAKNCNLTSTGNIPLNDLGASLYKGLPGGLYPNGQNTPPDAHLQAALQIARNEMKPLDVTGKIDLSNGKIVLISVGMSNTTQEFATRGPGAFKPRADADPAKNPQLVIVDCAQGGHAAMQWRDPNNDAWTTAVQRLSAAGVTPAQVQLAWVKLADRAADMPDKSFPAHALWHKENVEQVLRLLKAKFPNVKLAYLSSRTRAYENNPNALQPEPFAYESNFSVKWIIESQINGTANLNFDPAKGPAVAPLLLWGPYLWTDGATPRSDGFTWLCSDTVDDGIHPSPEGVTKVADQLLAFFKTHPTATSWFLRGTGAGQPPAVNLTANTLAGAPPLTVNFTVQATDPDGSVVDYAWTFDDGGFSREQNPTKTFVVAGSYTVRLTVTDNSGNHTTVSRVITVQEQAAGLSNVFYFPLVGDGVFGNDKFQTRLIFINTGDDTRVQLRFFDRQGNPLAIPLGSLSPNSQFDFPLKKGESLSTQTTGAGSSGNLVVGYAAVRTSSTVEGQAIFTRSQAATGVALYTAAVGAAKSLKEFTIFADTIGSRNTGLAIVSPKDPDGVPTNAGAASVTLRFYDTSFQLLQERTIQLNPGEAIAQYVEQDFFPGLGEKMGTLTGESDLPVIVLGMLEDSGGAPFPSGVPNLAALPVRTERAK